MRRARQSFSISVWKIWVLTYIAILVLPFCVNLVEYSVFSKRFNEQIEEKNRFVLKSMCNQTEEQLMFVENLSINLSLNDELNHIVENISLPLDAAERYTLYQFVNNFNFGYMQVEYQSRIFVYFKHIGLIAKSGSCQDLESFCRSSVSDQADAEAFMEILNEPQSGKYFQLNFNEKQKELFYIKSIPSLSEDNMVNILLHIDKEAISKDIEELYMADTGLLAVLDEHNNVILQVGSLGGREETVGVESLLKDKNILSYRVESDSTNWSYVYFLPKEEVYQEINHSKSLIIFFVMTVFAACTCIAALFLRSNYSNISDMMKLFKNETANVNEYSFLKEKIAATLSENIQYSEMLSNQNSQLKESILTALLENRELTGKYTNDELEKLGFRFEKDSFVAVVFAFEYQKEESYPRKFVIENIFSELTERSGFCRYAINYKNAVVYLIASEQEDMKQKLLRDIQYAYNFMKENFEFGFFCGVGSVHQRKQGISQSYREACEALQYCLITKEKPCADYDSDSTLFEKNYFYSRKTEERMFSLIQVNNRQKLREELKTVFQQAKERGRTDVDGMRAFVLSAVESVSTFCEKNKMSFANTFSVENEFVKNIDSCNSVGKMRDVICILFEDCYDRVFAQVNPVQDMPDRIVSFIEKNYRNQELGIQMIAEAFERSNDYIARKFKEKHHITIKDYINIVRVNEAKKLLGNSNELISTISEEVGFSNYRTFVRVFTNVTGISPKNYRDTNI